MSIASEITRINNAKEDIITAIKKRGGTVKDGTKIDGIANAIMDMPDSVKINGSKSVRANASGETIHAGSLIDITDTASADISEIKSDLTHTFDEYTNLLTMPTDMSFDYHVLVTPYAYTTTDYGFLIEYMNLVSGYESIKKFLTPVLFKLNAATSIEALKQCIHTAALSEDRFVVAVFGSYTAEGVILTNYQIRLFVFDMSFPYKSPGVEGAALKMIDQLFTFDSNAYMPIWTNTHCNGSKSTQRGYYYSMVTPIDKDRFMIPVRYGTSSSNKVGMIVFTIENGAMQAHSDICTMAEGSTSEDAKS